MIKHLLSITQLSREEVTRILDTAESFREVGTRVIKKVPALRGRTVVNLFYENSTRTRISFELAAKRLSADVINFSTRRVVGLEGREPEGHGADAGGDGRRRDRDPALVVGRAADALAVGAGVGPERRRRHARAPHPGAARPVHDARALPEPGGPERGDRRRRACTRGWPGRSRSRWRRWAAQVTLVGPPTLIPPEAPRLGRRWCPTTSTRCCRSWTSATCSASSGNGSASSSSRASASTRGCSG